LTFDLPCWKVCHGDSSWEENSYILAGRQTSSGTERHHLKIFNISNHWGRGCKTNLWTSFKWGQTSIVWIHFLLVPRKRTCHMNIFVERCNTGGYMANIVNNICTSHIDRTIMYAYTSGNPFIARDRTLFWISTISIFTFMFLQYHCHSLMRQKYKTCCSNLFSLTQNKNFIINEYSSPKTIINMY